MNFDDARDWYERESKEAQGNTGMQCVSMPVKITLCSPPGAPRLQPFAVTNITGGTSIIDKRCGGCVQSQTCCC